MMKAEILLTLSKEAFDAVREASAKMHESPTEWMTEAVRLRLEPAKPQPNPGRDLTPEALRMRQWLDRGIGGGSPIGDEANRVLEDAIRSGGRSLYSPEVLQAFHSPDPSAALEAARLRAQQPPPDGLALEVGTPQPGDPPASIRFAVRTGGLAGGHPPGVEAGRLSECMVSRDQDRALAKRMITRALDILDEPMPKPTPTEGVESGTGLREIERSDIAAIYERSARRRTAHRMLDAALKMLEA